MYSHTFWSAIFQNRTSIVYSCSLLPITLLTLPTSIVCSHNGTEHRNFSVLCTGTVLSNIETSTVYSRTGTLCFPASKRRLRSFYNKVNSLCVFYIIKSNKVIEPDVCLNLSRTLLTKNYGGFTMT